MSRKAAWHDDPYIRLLCASGPVTAAGGENPAHFMAVLKSFSGQLSVLAKR